MAQVAETMETAMRHQQGGRLQQAQQLYELVLQASPNHAGALHSLGVIAYHAGKYDEATRLIGEAIAKSPRVAQFYNSIGVVFEALGKQGQAVAAYQLAVSLKPDYAEAYNNMAVALHSQGDLSGAVDKCRQALAAKPDYAEAYSTMGFSLRMQGKYDEAIESYTRAVRLRPDFAEAYNQLGVVLNIQGRGDEAIENYRRALRLDADYGEVYNNLGIVLKWRGQLDEAVANYRQALRLEPDFVEAYYNLANALRDLGRCDEAIENYKQAIRLKPDYTGAHWNLAHAYLLAGRFEEGWKGYTRWRYADRNIDYYPHRYDAPCWDGSEFVGKRLFVHYEQGFGDNIQFLRYLPMAKARGGMVIYEARRPMLGLLRGFAGIDVLIEAKTTRPQIDFDFYAPLLDMPQIFGTTLETIPADVPYIYADPAKVQYWSAKLAGPEFKVGVIWAGRPTHGNDHNRSCRLERFAVLAGIEGVRLYGLQKGAGAEQVEEMSDKMGIMNIGAQFEDFADMAGAIENLDLVVSVDTAGLHLAGAMGKPIWALLPFAPDWRWMLHRQGSPWYPTMRLFRQKKWGWWEEVFQRVAEELRILVGKGRSRR